MGQAAFELRAEYAGSRTLTDEHGQEYEAPVLDPDTSFALIDGSVFPLGRALIEGAGVLVTDDQRVIDAAAAFPALKPARVPDEPAAVVSRIDAMSREELVSAAREVGLPRPASTSTAALREGLEALESAGTESVGPAVAGTSGSANEGDPIPGAETLTAGELAGQSEE